MGTKRVGLARIEALMEGLKRDIDLSGTTLSNFQSSYLDFATGNCSNLSGTPVTPDDTAVDLAAATPNAANILAVTLIPDAINTTAWDSGAAGSVYLPVCTKGTHTVLRILGDPDEANALTIFARGAVGESDALFALQYIEAGGSPGGVLTSGTAAVPTAIKLVYTPGATATNFLQAGSTIHFYAVEDNRWLVKVCAEAEGTGVTGAWTTATS